MHAADITLEKPLPHSLESERAVLGAIVLDGKAFFPATEILTAEDFYLEVNREIFRAMLALAEEESPIDVFTLREELRRAIEAEDFEQAARLRDRITSGRDGEGTTSEGEDREPAG